MDPETHQQHGAVVSKLYLKLVIIVACDASYLISALLESAMLCVSVCGS